MIFSDNSTSLMLSVEQNPITHETTKIKFLNNDTQFQVVRIKAGSLVPFQIEKKIFYIGPKRYYELKVEYSEGITDSSISKVSGISNSELEPDQIKVFYYSTFENPDG